MQLCSSGHDEVCYEGRDCPACEKISELGDLRATLETVKDDLAEANSELASQERETEHQASCVAQLSAENEDLKKEIERLKGERDAAS